MIALIRSHEEITVLLKNITSTQSHEKDYITKVLRILHWNRVLNKNRFE